MDKSVDENGNVDWDEIAAEKLEDIDYAAYCGWKAAAKERYYTAAKCAQEKLDWSLRNHINDYRSSLHKAYIVFKAAVLERQEKEPALTIRDAYHIGEPEYDELLRKEELAKTTYEEETQEYRDEFNASLKEAQEQYEAEAAIQVAHLLKSTK